MKEMLLVRFGEIGLKGENRPYFIDGLVKQIKRALRGIGKTRIQKTHGRIFVEIIEGDCKEAAKRLQNVFGIVGISPVIVVDKEMERIREVALQQVLSAKGCREEMTFKVETRRSDKGFPYTSPEINGMIGAYVLPRVQGLKVDVHHPQVTVQVEIRDKAYIYTENIPGLGGLPIGVNGKAALLLSGGIDSPVAGWMTMKRGVEVIGIHFHSFPFTSERAREKVIDLCHVLARYCGSFKLYIVSLTEIQKAIIKHCPEEFVTLIMRRFMMRIAQRIAIVEGAQALVTGESIGQVASQTIESMAVTNAVVEMPVFRPLVGFDKDEIIDIAQKIETFEISVRPYEDCCTIFVPKHPATRPKREAVEKAEEGVEWEPMIEESIKGAEVMILEAQ